MEEKVIMKNWVRCLPGAGCLLAGLGIAAFPWAAVLGLVYMVLLIFGSLFALLVNFTDLCRRAGDPAVSALGIAMACMGLGMYVGISVRLAMTP
jgi:hypothetical protein